MSVKQLNHISSIFQGSFKDLIHISGIFLIRTVACLSLFSCRNSPIFFKLFYKGCEPSGRGGGSERISRPSPYIVMNLHCKEKPYRFGVKLDWKLNSDRRENILLLSNLDFVALLTLWMNGNRYNHCKGKFLKSSGARQANIYLIFWCTSD